jgi:polysaccharide biosynthesis/export protein ExoF
MQFKPSKAALLAMFRSKSLYIWSNLMRGATKTTLLATVAATVVLAATALYSLDFATGQSAPNRSTPAPTSSEKVPLGIGDRLKISFFEPINMPDMRAADGSGAESQGALRTFYQRMDLSGEYLIDQDGALSIPLLGRLQVEGRELDAVRADLAASFSSVMQRTADVNVTIIERSPVYVVGPVKKPGAYKYTPGMIVLHAIALAGGLDRGDGNLSSRIEGAREMGRLRTAADQVRRLVARRARLEAQRDGLATLPMPIQLAKFSDEPSVRTFLATERALLQAEQTRHHQQESEIAAKLAAARNEVDALKGKLNQIDVQKGMRVERLNDMQTLRDRGVVTTNNVVLLRTELSDIEARRQDDVVAVVQAQARLAQAEEAKARLMSEEAENLTKAVATVDQEIADAQDVMASAGILAAVLQGPNGATLQALTYEILRQSKDGTKTLRATETSPLMPGDVLKVDADAASAVPQSRINTDAASAPPQLDWINAPEASAPPASEGINLPATGASSASERINADATGAPPASERVNLPVTSAPPASERVNLPVTSAPPASEWINLPATSPSRVFPVTSASPVSEWVNLPATSALPASERINVPATSVPPASERLNAHATNAPLASERINAHATKAPLTSERLNARATTNAPLASERINARATSTSPQSERIHARTASGPLQLERINARSASAPPASERVNARSASTPPASERINAQAASASPPAERRMGFRPTDDDGG